MADKLGPGSYNGSQLAIDTMIMQMHDLEFQRLENSTMEQLLHKQSSNELSEIQAQYTPEIDLVRNEMRNLEDKSGDEYRELMYELEELEETRDEEINQIEKQDSEREKNFQMEDSSLETRYNAVKEDKEGLEEVQDQNIERN